MMNQSTSLCLMSVLGPRTLTTQCHYLHTTSNIVASFLIGLGVCVFLDNATSTTKNQYLVGWALEMVQHGILDTIRAPFLITGHTKFAPDRVFAIIANSYNKSDVFNCQELVIISLVIMPQLLKKLGCISYIGDKNLIRNTHSLQESDSTMVSLLVIIPVAML